VQCWFHLYIASNRRLPRTDSSEKLSSDRLTFEMSRSLKLWSWVGVDEYIGWLSEQPRLSRCSGTHLHRNTQYSYTTTNIGTVYVLQYKVLLYFKLAQSVLKPCALHMKFLSSSVRVLRVQMQFTAICWPRDADLSTLYVLNLWQFVRAIFQKIM